MDPLAHDIEESILVAVNSQRRFDVPRELLLVVRLDRRPHLLERRIVGVLCQSFESSRIEEPGVRLECLGDESGERGVALEQPSSSRDAVRDVRAVISWSVLLRNIFLLLTSDPLRRNLRE